MKYHCIGKEPDRSLCGVKERPDTWIFEKRGFTGHYAYDRRCKRCSKILKAVAKSERKEG